MGALLHYLHHRQLFFDEKDESYPGVIARDSGGFHLRMQLNDALIEKERLGFRVLALGLVESRQIVEAGGQIGVRRSKCFLVNCQRSLIERL